MENKSGFTLIELLIVVTIIAIMGTFSFLSFGNFFDKYEYASYQKRIDNYLDIEDFNIRNNVNSSYEITFFPGNSGYLVSKNFFKATNFAELKSFDYSTLSGILSTTLPGTIFYNSDFGAGHIVTLNFSGGTTNFSLKDTYNGTSKINISFLLDGVSLNNYDIGFFESDILRSDSIPTIASLSGTNLYDKVIYSNILGKKEIRGFWGTNSGSIDEVYINLEKGSKEIPIKLTK